MFYLNGLFKIYNKFLDQAFKTEKRMKQIKNFYSALSISKFEKWTEFDT